LVSLLAVVLLGLIGAERVAAERRRARGERSPLEQLEASSGA
jgi:hypothetical protein